jgi:predicted membrane-bound spermidine synthase
MMATVFVSLLWPTSLMGLSLPLLSRAVTRQLGQAAGRVGWLYGINTFGAGIGSLTTGWYLAGTYGYEATVHVGGALSIIACLLALVAAGYCEAEAPAEGRQAPASAAVAPRERVPGRIWGWCLLVCASGFIAISLELVWFRLLDVVLQSNAYTFGHFLSFILAAYGLGSLCGARLLQRIQRPRRVFLWIQGTVVLYSLVAIGLTAWCMGQGWLDPYLATLIRFGGYLTVGAHTTAAAWTSYLVGYLVLPGVLLLPPNFLIGFNVPVAQWAVQTDRRLVGQRVGLMQVANILGNTAGSVLTGLVLLHFWGTAGAVRVIAVLGLMLALALVREEWKDRTERRRSGEPAAGGGLVAGGVLAASLLGVALVFPATTALWSALHGVGARSGLFIVAEDSSGVTALEEREGEGRLIINGQRQGTIPFVEIHNSLGAVGVLLHPDPERVLVIGIGSGGTPYSAGSNPNTTQVVAVEIVGSVLPVLRAYAEEPGGAPLRTLLHDERYQVTVGDGRRVLALSDAPFDIIEADAIYPWRSGSGFLYSREFFEAARGKLRAGGFMVQWAPTRRVEATFVSVFPYGVRVGGNILIGSNQPIIVDPQAIRARLEDPAFVAHWRQGGIDPSVFRRLVQGIRGSAWTPDTRRVDGEINTDLFPRDEYYLNNR